MSRLIPATVTHPYVLVTNLSKLPISCVVKERQSCLFSNSLLIALVLLDSIPLQNLITHPILKNCGRQTPQLQNVAIRYSGGL
jgi:hypothetical protein